MRLPFIIPLLCCVLLYSCNQQDAGKPTDQDTVTNNAPDSVLPSPSGVTPKTMRDDSVTLMKLSDSILITLKEKNYAALAEFIHPGKGIRFSPYGYIDTGDTRRLLPVELISLGVTNKKVSWGVYDGRESSIILSIAQYFDRFVYPHDFRMAPQQSVNRFLGAGNSLNNLLEVFPGGDFTEFYFPGFDPRYDGMDWHSLRLVFITDQGRYWLTGIVHDEWTI